MKKLTEKQNLFTIEYLVDLNKTQAYIRAGYKVKNENSAGAAAKRLFDKTYIQEAIQEKIKARQERTEITADRVLKEASIIAFSKITDYLEVVNGKVRIKDTAEVNSEVIPAISEIREGKDGSLSLKLHNKNEMLITLFKHLGLLKEKIEHSGKVEVKPSLDLSKLTIEELNVLEGIVEKAGNNDN